MFLYLSSVDFNSVDDDKGIEQYSLNAVVDVIDHYVDMQMSLSCSHIFDIEEG